MNSEPDVERHLTEIERHVRAARGDSIDRTPWTFSIPTGRDLKHLREACGLSIEEAADRIDYAPSTVEGWESGSIAPGREAIQQSLRLYRLEWPR